MRERSERITITASPAHRLPRDDRNATASTNVEESR